MLDERLWLRCRTLSSDLLVRSLLVDVFAARQERKTLSYVPVGTPSPIRTVRRRVSADELDERSESSNI